MPAINPYVIPTGGAIGLSYSTSPSGTISIERATSGASGLSAWTTIYSGAPLTDSGSGQFFVDVGDFLPAPLTPTAQYVYRITDGTGSVQTAALDPVSSVNIEQEQLLYLMQRLLQGAINSMTLPEGVQRATVSQAMPIQGFPPLPFVVINPDLVQMTWQKIGAGVELPNQHNIATFSEMAKRILRVSVLSSSATERDFYRDAIVAVFRVSLAYVFSALGLDLEHRWQASSYQVSQEYGALTPGFYGADVQLEINGVYNIAVTTDYGVIEKIQADIQASIASGASGLPPVDIEVIIPQS